MAVADEIDALAQRAKSDLDDLFNFEAHIHLIWKHFDQKSRYPPPTGEPSSY